MFVSATHLRQAINPSPLRACVLNEGATMTVAELIAKLRTVDQGLTVLSDGPDSDGYAYTTGGNIVVALLDPEIGFNRMFVHISHSSVDRIKGPTMYEVI